ncbi:MAG: SAM-dependent methyltransferase [Desulfosarcinaceae bacterium]|nr:SAM-dependent methyltransferase [Desulfosarcinaceae bacterium]
MNNGHPSKTARKVALNILTLGEKPEMSGVIPPGIIDATEKLLVTSGAAGTTTVNLYRSPQMVWVCEAFDWMMPGQFEAFAHRKAFFDRQVRESLTAGVVQVLTLGAGYDTMGWRLSYEFPNVTFFEIDHPATALLKAKGIEKMGPRPNLHLIAKELRLHRLTDVLRDDQNWDESASTLIIAEGLLQYLSTQAVRELFIQCALIAEDSRFAFTYIPTHQDGRPDAGPRKELILWLLTKIGEPWRWSIRPDQLVPFLRASGWANAPELLGKHTNRGVELYAVAVKAGRTRCFQERGVNA